MDIQFNRQFLNIADLQGDRPQLLATHPRHIGNNNEAFKADSQPSFGQMLFDSLNEVNRDQQVANTLSVQAVTNPDSVEAHDVTIALAQANLSLNLTRNVLDRVVQAYRELTTLR